MLRSINTNSVLQMPTVVHTMPIRAFIAYDFALAKRGNFANVLEDAKDTGAPELLIRYAGDSDSPKEHGSLWDTLVGASIDVTDRFLAYIDLPNANVGFEIGYAFGKGKPVGIYRFSSIKHDWLEQQPLLGHILHHANDASHIHAAIKNHSFMKLAALPLAGKRVMYLCPKQGGAPFRRQIDNAWNWVEPPLSEWTIDRLSEQFQDVGCVVWIILMPDEAEANRDGAENTALSLIAGFAHAHKEIDLHVFVHKNARFVADLGHVSKKFSSNANLKSLLATVQSHWEAKLVERAKLALPVETSRAENTLEIEKKALSRSYLQWLIACHERLEFRGVQHARGGVVSVELKQVYLALQADGTNPLERAAARQALLAELDKAIAQGEITPEEADTAIWLFVAGSPTMPSLESRDRLNLLDDKLKEILNLGEAYYRESQLVVLGDPGSGKTTLARWLSLVSAQAVLLEQPTLIVPLSHVDPSIDADARTISLGQVRIPILLRVSDYADERRRQVEHGNAPPRLLEYFGKHGWLGNMPTWDSGSARHGERIDATKLNQYLVDVVRSGDALIILDGLDEIPASALRDEIVEEVDFFAQQHVRARLSIANGAAFAGHQVITLSNLTASSPGNRLIVTSRIAGYHAAALRGNLSHVTVEPMAPAATARFITNWMRAVHAHTADSKADPNATQNAADAQSQKLIAKLKEPRQRGGRELATSPLLCGILATVFRKQKGELPQERVELYRQAVDLLLDVWLRRGNDEAELRQQRYELLDVLEPLAEHIHRHEPTGLIPEEALSKLTLQFLAASRAENPLRPSAALRTDVDDLIRVIREDVGLLAARGEKVYGFLHLTFQEYFAARFLVRDTARACARIREHLGDPRWREAIRLGFGHLSITEPAHLKALTIELLAAETELADLLPQAALTIVGSIQDIRGLDSDSVELLAEQLITTYALRVLSDSDRLVRRRDLLEGGLRRLIDAGFGKQVEHSLIQSLAASLREPALAAAAAQIICALDHHSARITDALLNALANDSLALGCPMHRALRLSLSPQFARDFPRVTPNPKLLPFRQALLSKPELAQRVRSDFNWLRVVLALYGGLGEYEVAQGLRTYNEFACYLQQEGARRSRYELAYRGQWGGKNGDVALNMADFLDTKGGTLSKRGKHPLVFSPLHVSQDSVWTSLILAALEKGQGVKQFLEAVQKSALPSTNVAKTQLAIIELAIGERSFSMKSAESEDIIQAGRTLVAENLSDAVVRAGTQLIGALSDLKGRLNSKEWWALVEAALTTHLRHGGEPLGGKLLSLRNAAKSEESSLLLAEALYHFSRGWGDDAAFNSADFADTATVTPSEFLGAFSRLPITAHSAWNLYFNEWPLVALPPAKAVEGELHPSIITNMEMMPASLGFMRMWTLQVLKPIIDSHPDLLPEILAFGLGNVGQRGVRNDVFSTFAPELSKHPQPSEAVFKLVRALSHPYHRARASLRLSIHLPAKRQILLADAALLAAEIADPDHAAQIFEWLASIAADSQRGEYWALARSKIREIADSDARARLWGRLGLLASPEDANECFGRALQACAEISDEFDRSTTIRLLRRVLGGLPEMDEKFNRLTVAIHNPIFRARAAEAWGSVFRHVDPAVLSQPEHLHLWAVLFVAAQASEDKRAGQTDSESLWLQLANEPSQETAGSLFERSQSELLKCSPLVTLCLDKLLANDQPVLVTPLLRRIRASAAEVTPFWRRQLASANSDVASISALILGEMHGVSGELVPGLITALCSSDDLTRNRASEILNTFERTKAPVFRTSLIGREGLDTLFSASSFAGTPRSIGNVVSWFSEGLLYDSPEQVQAWAQSLEQDPLDVASTYALRTIRYIETHAFDQLMIEFGERTVQVKKAILVGLTHLAKHARLEARQLATATEIVRGNPSLYLDAREYFDFTGADIVRIVLDTLKEAQSDSVSPEIAAKARELLRVRHGFSWNSVFDIPDDAMRLEKLKAIGQTMYVTNSIESLRWQSAAECARQGLDTPGFLELLCEWTALMLSQHPDDPRPLDYERTYVIEILAGAAMLAPARFLRCRPSTHFQPMLIAAAITHCTYTARADSIRLLGYQRHLTLDVLVALRSSLLDVSHVRDSAMEAVTLFRHMDANVLPELKRWLIDESGLVAYATAQLLTGIARHAQTTGRLETGRSSEKLRREITSILADAARDPRANRQLDFGAASFPAPFVPRLCDHFYDCMLQVAGFEEFRRSPKFESMRFQAPSRQDSANAGPPAMIENSSVIITDGAVGNLKQARALASGLGVRALEVGVRLSGIDRFLAPHFKRAQLSALRFEPQFSLANIRLAIGCGHAAAAALDALKRSQPLLRTVQILDPRCDPRRFDVVICPEHDGLHGANVLRMPGALNDIDDAWLAQGQALAAAAEVKTLLLLGAPTRHAPYDVAMLRTLLASLSMTGLCISASRRTPAAFLLLLRASGARVWCDSSDGENPYQAWLSSAEHILVSPDSINMISEACATRARVTVLFPERTRGKTAHFLASIEARLSPEIGRDIVPLRPSKALVEALKTRFLSDIL
jgi:mitochondrial fission protein ELM1